MILDETVGLVGVGVAVGLAVFLAGGHYLRSLLFDLSPTDPATIVLSVLALLGIAAIAGLLPARRASRLDPVATLRLE